MQQLQHLSRRSSLALHAAGVHVELESYVWVLSHPQVTHQQVHSESGLSAPGHESLEALHVGLHAVHLHPESFAAASE